MCIRSQNVDTSISTFLFPTDRNADVHDLWERKCSRLGM